MLLSRPCSNSCGYATSDFHLRSSFLLVHRSLGKLFRYLDEIDENHIMTIKRSLSDEQQENLRMIFELIHKSDMKCPLFLKNSNASSSINSKNQKAHDIDLKQEVFP